MATPIPEHQSIFGDTYHGVPSPNIPHCHPYPTRYHGPIYNIPVFGKPYRQQTWRGGYGPLTGLGSASECGVNEIWDEQVAACMCRPGTMFDSDANECRPVDQVPYEQEECLANGKRWINGACRSDCGSGYGFDVDGNCVRMDGTQAPSGGGGGAMVPASAPSASKAGISKPILIAAGVVGGLLVLNVITRRR